MTVKELLTYLAESDFIHDEDEVWIDDNGTQSSFPCTDIKWSDRTPSRSQVILGGSSVPDEDEDE